MAMETDVFNTKNTERCLAVVKSTYTGMGRPSLYVEIPRVGETRRTDGGARDTNSTTVEFESDARTYKRKEYVLTRVEDASFESPPTTSEKCFKGTDIPVICPQCGRVAAAAVKSEYDSMTGGICDSSADVCVVQPDNRGEWYEFRNEMTFVHGTE